MQKKRKKEEKGAKQNRTEKNMYVNARRKQENVFYNFIRLQRRVCVAM